MAVTRIHNEKRITLDPLVGSPVWPLPTKHRDRAGVPAVFSDAFNRAAEGSGDWPLLAFGSVGSGKTCAALLAVEWAGRSCYVTVSDLCRMLIEAGQGLSFEAHPHGCGGYKRYERDVWRDWEDANLAVLDELGARDKVSDHHYETVKRAIDLRLDWGKPLLVCTNLSLEQLSRCYDDRISSRLASGTIIELTGDRRLSPA